MKLSIFLLVLLYMSSCQTSTRSGRNEAPDTISKDQIYIPAENDDSVLLTLSRKIITDMENREYVHLSEFFHPEIHVRFSPYAYVDTVHDIKFTASEFKDLTNTRKQQKLKWGIYDGSGDTINLSVPEYFERFVYDVNFSKKGKVSVNKFQGGSNTLNNLSEIYPGDPFVEYYFPGEDPPYGGMDWKALRLVYKKYKNNWYLVGIVHDEWTI